MRVREPLVTGTTVAAFEPALDYVVVKLPRFPFDKFPPVTAIVAVILLKPWTLKRATLGTPWHTRFAPQVRTPAWLITTVRVEVKPDRITVPKSMSCSFVSWTGLATLTVVVAEIDAALAGDTP